MSKASPTHTYESTACSLPAASVRSTRRPGEDPAPLAGEEPAEFSARVRRVADDVKPSVVLRLIQILKEL